MNEIGNNIRKRLQKRQDALARFKARKQAFLLAKGQITKEIEEARILWEHTLEQLPKQVFER